MKTHLVTRVRVSSSNCERTCELDEIQHRMSDDEIEALRAGDLVTLDTGETLDLVECVS